jgi:hypothetical protein
MKLPPNSASRLPGPSGNQLEKVHGKSEERYTPGELAPSTARQSAWFNGASGVGEVRAHADDGRAFPNHRWARHSVRALHPTRKGSSTDTGTDELGTAATIAAPDHGERRVGNWLQTFAKPSLILRHLRNHTPSSSEDRASALLRWQEGVARAVRSPMTSRTPAGTAFSHLGHTKLRNCELSYAMGFVQSS